MLENFVATPFVPFAIGQYKCAGKQSSHKLEFDNLIYYLDIVGIMVTASHNPKADNGYKVYWGNGAQIIPPHDINIANFINSNLAPWQVYDVDTVRDHPQLQIVTEDVAKAYVESISRLSSSTHEANAQSPVRIAYTAMHGVGRQWVERAFKAYHHPSLHVVPSQSEPDPEFPTVVFPNPEEKGALDEAMRFATSEGCTLILANDPDADRLAAAERLEDSWRVFSGNEIGVLLGYWQIKQWKETNAIGAAAVLASVVSSRMLKKIAEAEGVQFHDTLTGFKWLGNRAQELRATGVNVLFSYEEALGFCCGDVLCDKDGISAACIFAEMAGALQTKGMTVNDHLQGLSSRYGEFVSYNSYIICRDSALTDRIFLRLRNGGDNNGYWTSVNGVRIIALKDITMGYDSAAEGNVCSMPTTPDSHMIMYEFENGVTITLRTSGTEPKIKFYTEIAGQPGQQREELRSQLVSFVDAVVEEMLEPTKHGLSRA